MVEPKLVIDEYKKLDKKKPVACATNNKEINMDRRSKKCRSNSTRLYSYGSFCRINQWYY
jgi:hypothetical protein